MDRRQFIKFGSFITASVATGVGLTACGGSSSGANAPAASGAWKFPQSVASGDPHSDSIILWTRAVPATADDVAVLTGVADSSLRVILTAADNRMRPLVSDTAMSRQSQSH